MKRKYQSNKILKEIIEGSSSNIQRREAKKPNKLKQTNEGAVYIIWSTKQDHMTTNNSKTGKKQKDLVSH